MVINLPKEKHFLADIESWPHWDKVLLIASKEYGLAKEEAQPLLREYQRFLGLILLGYRNIGMYSTEIDKIWHSHILSTKRYREFCHAHIGKFVDHIPTFSDGDDPPETPPPSCIPDPPPETPPAMCTTCAYEDTKLFGKPTFEAFVQVYKEVYQEPPPLVWNVDQADGMDI